MQACIEAGLVANELVHFDLTAVVVSGHRWSPYERAVILSKALIRYLELVWADQMPQEPFPEALRVLAAEVALEALPHKTLNGIAPERVVQSVAEGTDCEQCELYARCYPSGGGEPKQFTLDPAHHRRWQQNREHCRTDEYKVAQKARSVEEGRFGLAKMNHGAGKTPYRSDEMNHIAGLMIASK